MRVLICLFLCLAFVACTASRSAPLQAPSVSAADGRLSFVAWYTTKDLDVPLQGVLRYVSGAGSGLRAERMGLVLTQGRTVGVTQWTAQGVCRQEAPMPGAERMLMAVERAVSTLAQFRGIEIFGETADCTVLAQDAVGPLELRCGSRDEQVTVRVTGVQQ